MDKACVQALLKKGVKMPQAVSQCYPKATTVAKKAIAAGLAGAALGATKSPKLAGKVYGKASAALEARGAKKPKKKKEIPEY